MSGIEPVAGERQVKKEAQGGAARDGTHTTE